MDNFRFFTPTEVVFGKGVENQTGALAAKHGTRALIVYGKCSVVKSGLLARVMQSLKDAGIECEGFGGAQPNPTLSHAEEGVQKALDFCADIIIGVGGGSAIDTAKGIAHGAANAEHKLWDIWTKKVPLTKSLPVGAVLTMPAAGSEMSDSAVLTNTVLGKKAGIGTEFNRCRFAVINPEWGATLPAYQLAAGITDIMMHTMERYFIPGIKCDLTDGRGVLGFEPVAQQSDRVRQRKRLLCSQARSSAFCALWRHARRVPCLRLGRVGCHTVPRRAAALCAVRQTCLAYLR